MKRVHKILIFSANISLSMIAKAQSFTNVSFSNVNIINSAAFEFSPAFYKEGIVFVSNSDVDGKKKVYDKLINTHTMSIFIAKQNQEGKLQKPEPFSLNLVSSLHEGPLTFDSKNETVFFCRNDNVRENKAKYVKKISYMKIFSSHILPNNTWSPAEEIPINVEKSDACHPSLSSDGERLYFSSNRPGGYGGMDLYMTEKVNGKWGTPVNLGPKINTEKNEVFPFIHANNILFYSSDCNKSKGGLDIFYTMPDKKGTYQTPQNLGTPFNSDKDDFGFILDKDTKIGFLTSDRVGGAGFDDIYTFALADGLKLYPDAVEQNCCEKVDIANRTLALHILDQKTGKPIENVSICPTSNVKPDCKELMSDKNGDVHLKLARNDDFFIKIGKETYSSESINFIKTDDREDIVILMNKPEEIVKIESPKTNELNPTTTIENNKPTKVIESKKTENTLFVLKNIYYDFDKADIRPDASKILDDLVNTLNTHPDLIIELSSHTDSRGKNAYNDDLSLRRNMSVVQYLLHRGVKSNRFISGFYGEQALTNDCGDGVPCSEENHQLNRRTEIKVLKKL